MGFLRSKSVSLTITDSARLNWLKLNKKRAIEEKHRLMGPCAHMVTSHRKTLCHLLPHRIRGTTGELNLDVDR